MRYSVQKKYRVSRFFMARLKSSKLVVKSLFLKPQSACNYCIYGTFEEITYFSYQKVSENEKKRSFNIGMEVDKTKIQKKEALLF